MAASDVFGFVGTTLENRYRVEAPVGEGGFGVVYRATNINFDEKVALKCLKIPAHFTEEARATFLQKFREEGRLLKRLADKASSVVAVSDFGVANHRGVEVPYLAMEWLEGSTLDLVLAERLADRRGPFPEREALELLRPALAALDAAHTGATGQVIAHRDIKPENLFLRREGGVKVLDFGIAKVMQEGEQITQQHSRTSSNFHAYSPRYGAPEQFYSKKYGESGPWTDVHALGLVLVELLSGRRALEGDEFVELYNASVSPDRPSPRALGVAVSNPVEALCSRALALSPRDRYPTASAMLADLDACLAGSPTDDAAPASAAGSPPGSPSAQPRPGSASRTSLAGIDTFLPGQPPSSVPPRASDASPSTSRTSLASIQTLTPEISPAGAEPAPARRFPVAAAGGGLLALAVAAGLFWRSGSEPRGGAALATAAASGGPPASALVGALESSRAVGALPPAASPSSPPAALPAPAASPATAPAEAALNRWVTVRPPERDLVLGIADGAPDSESGFRQARKILAPKRPFQIHQHEVTWAEVDAWFAAKLGPKIVPIPGSPGDPKARAQLPATNLPWEDALGYCKNAGGRLPTEEEWEFAARGPELAPHPWGASWAGQLEAIAYRGAKGKPSPVMSQPLDCTPEAVHGERICDMAGNVREWTADVFRLDRPAKPEDEAWTTAGGKTWRALRGLPLEATRPPKSPVSAAAYRGAICVSGACPKGSDERLRFIGFRCVRDLP